MFGRLGRFAADHAKFVLVTAVLLLLGAGALGVTVFGKLQSEGFTDPAAESTHAQDLIDTHFGGDPDLVFAVAADHGSIDDTATARAGTALTERLGADARLAEVTSYFGTNAPPLRGEDGRHAVILATFADNVSDDIVEDLRADYGGDTGAVTVDVGGAEAVGVDIGGQVGKDLALAEAIAVPIILVLLVLVFGSVVAALLPLAIGTVAIIGTFAVLSVLGSLTDVSVFAVNLTTALGLGLAIDYALLMVSRFREELADGHDIRTAVERTVATAGRTIVFSAATVAVALAMLLLFPLYFLRSFAYAGIGVVVIAMVSALVVLPALLAVLGPKVNSGRLPWTRGRTPTTVSTFWAKVAGTAMRRPLLTGAPVVILLLVAATPLLRVEFGTPDDRVLPTTTETRIVGDTLRDQFPTDQGRTLSVVTEHSVDRAALADYATRLSRVDGIAAVTGSAGTFADGRPAGTAPSDAALSAPGAERLTLRTTTDPHSTRGQDLVATIRGLAAPTGVFVGGAAAVLVDSKQAIADQLPLAIGLIAVTTFLLLFLFTGSVLQPLRALLFNTLGLTAIMGLMVMVFQEGWFASWLGFTPQPLDVSTLVLMFCIVFGLSMDYEVFVLSRIKETAEAGADPRTAVTYGLSRTGRLISMAAVLLAVSLLAFGTSGVSFIQMFGIGSGLAILVDATLIRGVLVPVGMRLLGRKAWWAPRWLRAVHDRVGLRDAPAEPPVRQPVGV